jgi:hypothetical protein
VEIGAVASTQPEALAAVGVVVDAVAAAFDADEWAVHSVAQLDYVTVDFLERRTAEH